MATPFSILDMLFGRKAHRAELPTSPPKCHDCKQPATTWVQFSYMVGRPEIHLCDACCNKEIRRREQSEWKLPVLMVPLSELACSPALKKAA